MHPLNGPLNKGYNTFDLSIKGKFCGPYRTMVIQFYLLKRKASVSKIVPKLVGPKIHIHYLEISPYNKGVHLCYAYIYVL